VDNIVTVNLDFNRMTLPFRTEFPVAGARCLLSTNSHEILRLSMPWQSAQDSPEAQSIRMEVLEDSNSTFDTNALPHFRGSRHLVFAMLKPGSFLNFDLQRRRMIGVLSPAAARDPNFWNAQLLPMMIGLLGTTVGIAPLHCACLDREGSGLLVAGNSGAGKSTLTAALAKQGFGVVSDDWTYVSNRAGRLVAHGMFAPVKLLPDTVRYFPELHQIPTKKTLNGEVAHEIDPAKVLHAKWKSYSLPKWVLFLERTSTPGCRFMPCRPEHLIQFFEQNSETLPPELPAAVRTRTQIIQRLSNCDCWILRTGDDPMRTAAAIDEFLPGE
jgi:hypothetical protein